MLAELGDPSGYPVVLAALRGDRPDLRAAGDGRAGAFSALGRRRHAPIDLVGALTSRFRQESVPAVRTAIVYALAKTGNRAALATLNVARTDASVQVANAARVAVQMLGATP